MMGGKTAVPLAIFSLLVLLPLAFAEDIVFFESFSKDFKDRWAVSEYGEYQGVWKHAPGNDHGDNGLLVSEKAKKYAIATTLPDPVDPKVDTLVLQYDLRLQNGLDCGGAYLKFLMPQKSEWSPSKFKDDTPYSIMFGPDKCGSTNKVHFIFRHKNPKTGEYVEHHLKNPPPIVSDKLSHVYTAVVYTNNTVKILIDGVEKKVKDLLSPDFQPTVLPPETIPDPEDKKPEDWDERAKIPDPEASKPDDWDEDAPAEVEDQDAEKPSDWLDDEPLEVDDPDSEKPSDWDDEEDGEWEPSKIPNPKCQEVSGCGVWKRPTKKNPEYKGKWHAPMIDNPNYKGKWAPREIPNPGYFHLDRPNLEPVSAVGIEIWTMSDGILFDNILVTNSEAVAEEYRKTKWLPKKEVEDKIEELKKKKDEEKVKKNKKTKPKKEGFEGVVFNGLHEIAEKLSKSKLFSPYKSQIEDILSKAEDHPQITYAVLALLFTLTVAFVYFLIPGGKKKTKVPLRKAKKEDISTPDDAPVEEETTSAAEPKEESEIKEDKKAVESQSESENDGESKSEKVRRRPRRDN